MVILAKLVAWGCLISAIGFTVMATVCLYQSYTGKYGPQEAFGDPLGSAIVYLMAAAIVWMLRILAKNVVEDDDV